MEREIWICIEIDYNKDGVYNCSLAQQVGDEEMTIDKLDLLKAKKMMWELVLAGGTHEVRVNRFDRHLIHTQAYIFMPY